MSISPVHLTSHEYTVTIRFCGADVGKFPASIPSNPDITFKSNSVRFAGGQQLAAFSTAQDLTELHRIIKNDPSISISSNLAIPSSLISQYQSNGPLVQVTATPVITEPVVWTDPPLPIEVFSPVGNGLYHSPIEVVGFSQTFEGNVNLRLTDDEGNVLAERSTTGGSVDGFAFFHSYLRFTVTEPITGMLEIFETSAEDGSEINTVTIPLTLLPGQRVIDINNPTLGQAVCAPVVVAGYSNTFEASMLVELVDRSGATLNQTIASGGNLGIYAEFLAALENDTSEAQALLVGAYEEAASGAGPVDHTRYPVTLYPAGSAECP